MPSSAIACFLLSLFVRAAGAAPAVELFTPQGVAKNVTQVRARFTADVVKFGDPYASAPFRVECPAEGTGRWLEPREWVYDFKEALPAGLRCAFVAADGKRFEFSTGGPAIVSTHPYEGDPAIEEDAIFILTLDAEPD